MAGSPPASTRVFVWSKGARSRTETPSWGFGSNGDAVGGGHCIAGGAAPGEGSCNQPSGHRKELDAGRSGGGVGGGDKLGFHGDAFFEGEREQGLDGTAEGAGESKGNLGGGNGPAGFLWRGRPAGRRRRVGARSVWESPAVSRGGLQVSFEGGDMVNVIVMLD